MMETDEAIEWFKRLPEISEPRRQIGTYRVVRDPLDGSSPFGATVTIWDAGPEAGIYRYSVEARTDGGRFAMGNPERTIEAALSMVHWYDLDP